MRNIWLFTALITLTTPPAWALEQAAYEVVQRADKVELRRYQPVVVAETLVKAEFDKAGDQAFPILFGYISGKNQSNTSIAMTTPVQQSADSVAGEKIAMTAPVLQSPQNAEGTYRFGFVMPAQYTLATVPRPSDPRISLRGMEARLVAALGYSGSWSIERYQRHEAELMQAVNAAGWQIQGPPVFARYDPPLMPWFLRRNEVLVELRADSAGRPITASASSPTDSRLGQP